MKTKNPFSRTNGTMLFLFYSLFFIAHYVDALAFDGIIIGYTKHPEATAYNNGRRIVRTSTDRRIVVYQDSLENRPAVVCVYSDDGIHWPKPAIVAHGSFPSVAVADNDDVYLVSSLEDNKGFGISYSQNGALTWEKGAEIRPVGAIACRYPVVEATPNAVHTVWQQQRVSTPNERICYQRFNKDLSATLTPIHVLSADTCRARFPVIQGDLEFEADLLHVVWCDEPMPSASPRLMYCYFFVCYETFRSDSIDVVWTEGNSGPYKVIYRRMAKQYSRQPVEHDREQAPLPKEVVLWPNYPNPFNNSTIIELQVTKRQWLEVGVFDLNGKCLRTLFVANASPGVLRLPWDATDDKGKAISSGIYWIKVTAERNVLAQKILLLK